MTYFLGAPFRLYYDGESFNECARELFTKFGDRH